MSTFRRRYAVVVDGEPHEITTKPADFLGAERDLAFEEVKSPTETAPMYLQFRIVWRAFRRVNPSDPLAHDFAKFLELVDDIDDLELGEAGEPLSPTQPAVTASSP